MSAGGLGAGTRRQTHWVDADVLALLNAAHAEAERRAAVEVDVVHLLVVLAGQEALRDAFEAARIDADVLRAMAVQHARVLLPTGLGKPRTARDLRLLLDLSQRTAAVCGSRVIGLQDLLATLLACPSRLAVSVRLERWLWAARAYPGSNADLDRTVAQTPSQPSATVDPAPLVKPPEAVVEDVVAPPAAATSARVVRLEPRADIEDLADEIAQDPGQEPDPELERLGVRRYYLSLDDEIVRAPSIGPRTAEKLRPHGLTHVKHLLACEPERLSARLGARHLTASRIMAWKNQARLVCTIPWLRGTHAQLLVGAGYASIEKILSTDRSVVCAAVMQFSTTRDGQAILRAGPPPELDRIMRWIENSQQAEPQRAQSGRATWN